MNDQARTALVTGANRGLGLETAEQLAARGLRVLVSSREAAAAQDAVERMSLRAPPGSVVALPLPLDVANEAQVAAVSDYLRTTRATIHVLVNNAGIALDGFNAEVARRTIEVNFFGPLRVTEALLPLIPTGGTIVMVSSGMGALSGVDARLRARFTDPALTPPGIVGLARELVADVAAGCHRERGWPSSAYSVSKIALNALVRVWAKELRRLGIVINAVCPGWARTDMGGPGASRSVEKGARSIVWAAMLHGDSPTGGFFRDGRPIDW